jgi:hypothetical protein
MSEAGPNDAQEKLDTQEDANQGIEIAYGLTVYVTTEGKFGVEPTGEVGLMESIGLLSQALESAKGQLYAQQSMQVQFMARQAAEQQKREGVVIANPNAMPNVRAMD